VDISVEKLWIDRGQIWCPMAAKPVDIPVDSLWNRGR